MESSRIVCGIARSWPANTRSRTWRRFPWIVPHELQGQKLQDFPKLKVWFETIRSRPAVVRGLDVVNEKCRPMSEEVKKILFGQTAANVLVREKD